MSTCAFGLLLPKRTADNISKLFARFLWRNNSERKPIFWKSRGLIELPKGMGGLGIRNVRAFKLALLAKQVVRIHEEKDTLVSRVLYSKYKHSSITQGLKGAKIAGASWGYKGMCKAVYACRSGFRRLMGNGRNTRIMEDNWLDGNPLKVKSNTSLAQENLLYVADLVDVHTNNGNRALVWRLFQEESANRILGMYISQDRDREDKIV